MKKLSFLALILFLTLCIQAQKKGKNPNLPAFGSVEKADLEMKSCDFDDKAEAMILLDEGTLEYVFNKGMELKRRVRVKILNNNGLDWANVHLNFRSGEDISGLDAQTYNLDASGNVVVTKVEKKLVYEKKLNKKLFEKAFTFPEVKVGSIIEYKFKHLGVGLMDWYFQRSIPVRYSQFTIDFPKEIEVSSIPYCNNKYEVNSEHTSSRSAKSFSMEKVPAFRDEPFIINEDYYRDRLETKVTALNVGGNRVNRIVNWPQVIKFLMEDEDFGVQIKKNIPRTADLDEKLKTITSPFERMKTIYKYVQANMEWNEYMGIWALDGVKSAWKDKKGTAGEINLILVNLLRDADLDAKPILVSTHDNGIVNTIDAGTYEYPGFFQFNKVLAYVTIGEKEYYLDATQKGLPVHLMPSDILMTQGLVIEKLATMEWGWKRCWNEGAIARNMLMINASIEPDGKMKGEAVVNSYDYAKQARIGTVKKGKDKFIEQFITASNPSMNVDDISFENADSDSLPLIQKIRFTQPLNAAGEYQYFSCNLLTGLEKNPFVADSRFSDVFFGAKQSFILSGNFRLPEGYEFDELPKNMKMILPDTSIVITRISQLTENTLMTRITLDIKKPMYSPEEYPILQEFYLRLFDVLNEQFVVRKKKKA